VIDVSGLTKHYGAYVAVDDVSFRVAKGEIVGFLGPNGAGKSTTLRMLAGFLGATRGTVTLGGVDVAEEPIRAKQQLGRAVPQGDHARGVCFSVATVARATCAAAARQPKVAQLERTVRCQQYVGHLDVAMDH
jgi:ABC-type branched-subunit amino acid transport system ATPase component